MFASTISLKPVSETAEDFVQVVSPISNGVLRSQTSAVAPDTGQLLIVHSSTGKGSTAGQRHVVSLKKVIDDAAGSLHGYTASLTLTKENNGAITNAMVYDSVRQLIDFFATTSPITVDTGAIDSLLRGEA